MTVAERIRMLLDQKAATDPRLRMLLKRIRSGKATFADTAEYSRIMSKLAGQITAQVLPETSEEIEEAAAALLHDRYEDMNSVLSQVQQSIDRAKGIRLAPRRAAFPAERVQLAAHSLVDPTVTVETRQRRARNAVENVSQSFHDDYIKENADFRERAGLRNQIIRIAAEGCCDWCAKIAGTYEAGTQPADLFRRHDKCPCTIIYETGKTRQTLRGRGRKWEVVSEEAQEKHRPRRLTIEEAKKRENERLSRYRGLTSGEDRGIIKSIDVDDYELATHGKGIRPEVNTVILDTMKRCEKEGGFIISEISTHVAATSSHGTPILQIEPLPNDLLQLNVNAAYLSGKSLEEVNKAFLETPSTVVNSLEEAVVHESGHAISIKGKTVVEVEKLYQELKNAGLPGVSKIALDDGAECLAELEVLRHRGVKVSKDLADFYKQYMGRDY